MRQNVRTRQNHADMRTSPMIDIIKYKAKHWPQVWGILEPVFRAGETYPYATDITEKQAQDRWLEKPTATYVALENDVVMGTFYIKPNQPSLGAHVCNCGYVVGQNARGKGVAGQMCDFSQIAAHALGFSAMQYNLVVATNKTAVALWQRHGFHIVGNLPKAFNHKRLGLVDAYLMYKELS